MTVSKFTPEAIRAAVKMAESGGQDIEIATAMKVGRDTFYRYQKLYPEFKAAIAKARAPKLDSPEIAKAQWRKDKAEAWLDHTLETHGETMEWIDDEGITKKRGGAPPRWLLERILGLPEVKDATEFKMEFRILGPGEIE